MSDLWTDDTSYGDWIRDYVLRACKTDGLRNKCRLAAAEMREAFPELTPVPGQVALENGERWCHVWLVTPTGQVLDPTALQFKGRIVEYRPLSEEDPQPTGQCWNCWGYRYGRSRYCTPSCGREWRKRCRNDPTLEMRVSLQVMASVMGVGS